MMNYSFEKGEELYYNGDYKGSFEIFNVIFNDIKTTLIEKSDALNMLGVLLRTDPSLSTNNEFDESLIYFRKAIELNPDNLGALLNIVDEFGNLFGQHKDLELFKFVYNKLITLSSKLSDSDKKMLKNKYKLYLHLLKNEK